jgi:hypothetical protein
MRTSDQIAKSNDLFRTTMINSPRHRIVLTEGVASSIDRELIITKIREFKDFSRDNDPYKEHDFGKVVVNGKDYFFKIDYFDSNYEMGVDHYSEPYALLMTIMLASEY